MFKNVQKTNNCSFSTYLARIVGIVEPVGHGQLRSGRQTAVDDGALDAQLLETSGH